MMKCLKILYLWQKNEKYNKNEIWKKLTKYNKKINKINKITTKIWKKLTKIQQKHRYKKQGEIHKMSTKRSKDRMKVV